MGLAKPPVNTAQSAALSTNLFSRSLPFCSADEKKLMDVHPPNEQGSDLTHLAASQTPPASFQALADLLTQMEYQRIAPSLPSLKNSRQTFVASSIVLKTSTTKLTND